jgi:hypothetical protein
MKNTAIRKFAFVLVLTSLGTTFGYAASAEGVDHMTVTGPTAEQVETAKHKISLIQSDPGYYYAGAWGAKHRIQDVRALRQIVERGERLPASVKN